ISDTCMTPPTGGQAMYPHRRRSAKPLSGRPPRASRGNALVEVTDDVPRDHIEAVLDSEVPGVEPMNLRVGQVTQIGLAALGRKEDVSLAPEDQRFRLAAPQELLPRRIQRHVRPVVVQQIELNAAGVRTLHESKIHLPVVRADPLGLSVSVLVDELDAVEF